MFVLMPSTWASVVGEVNKANDFYKHGQFDDALKLYQKASDKDDKSAVVKYDLGTAYYKRGDYAKALGYLQQAAQDKNINIRPKAQYNLGNTLYKSGIQKENTDVDGAVKSLQEALGHYGQTIAVDPKDQDALFNQDFVKKEIERLKKKKQQQQRQQNQQQQQDQKKQQQNQQNQQSQQHKQGQQNQQEKQLSQQDQQSQQNKSKEQKKQQSSPGSKEQKQKNAQAQAQEDQKELDRKQSEDLLEEYQENEEPKKLLNYMPKKIDERPVLKDW